MFNSLVNCKSAAVWNELHKHIPHICTLYYTLEEDQERPTKLRAYKW